MLATHVTTSSERVEAIVAGWLDRAQRRGGPDEAVDPLAQLAGLREAELDLSRAAALDQLAFAFRREPETARAALERAARSSLLSAAVFILQIGETEAQAARQTSIVLGLREELTIAVADERELIGRRVRIHLEERATLLRLRDTYLLSYREALETLWSDIPAPLLAQATTVLREELGSSGRGDLARALDRLSDDLVRFGRNPGMDRDALLRMVLD